ncbi:MAG: HEAT repeat domain-containing protein [Planctomycetota bacterium]
MNVSRWRLSAAVMACLALAACESENKSANGGGSGGSTPPPSDSANYDWVIKAREAEATDPKSAADALAKGGKDALPFLIWQLTGDDTPVAMKAADALVSMGADAVPALDKVVRSKAAHGRNWAIWALGQIGAASKPASAGIRDAGKEPAFRQVSAEALSKIER